MEESGAQGEKRVELEEQIVLSKKVMAMLAPPCCTSLDTCMDTVKTPGRIRPPAKCWHLLVAQALTLAWTK